MNYQSRRSFEQTNGDVRCKHPAMLPYKHWVSLLITRHMHQRGHSGIASTTAKIRRKFWILRAHNLAKKVKHECVFCKRTEHKLETQLMADLPEKRLAPQTPPFNYTSCDYFGPYAVKVGRNKTAKHYGVIFTCLNTIAIHLELAVDYSTMSYKFSEDFSPSEDVQNSCSVTMEPS